MAEKFTVSLQKIINEFKLESIYTPKPPEEIFIDENDVNRPVFSLWDFMNILIPNEYKL